MAHECPECGQWCHCGGDIDDCGFNFAEDQAACKHCPPDQDHDEMDEDGCLFPGQCCMPGPHNKHECHTPDMLQDDPEDVCCACGKPLGCVRLTNKDRVHQWHPECDFMVCKRTHTANAHALAEERSDDSQQRVVGGGS